MDSKKETLNRLKDKDLLVVIFGPPCSGKTSLAIMLNDKYASTGKYKNCSINLSEQNNELNKNGDTLRSQKVQKSNLFTDHRSEWIDTDEFLIICNSGEYTNNIKPDNGTGMIDERVFDEYKDIIDSCLFIIVINPFRFESIAQEAFLNFAVNLHSKNQGHSIADILRVSANVLFSLPNEQFDQIKTDFFNRRRYQQDILDKFITYEYRGPITPRFQEDAISIIHTDTGSIFYKPQIDGDPNKHVFNFEWPLETLEFSKHLSNVVSSDQKQYFTAMGRLIKEFNSENTITLFTHKDLVKECGLLDKFLEKSTNNFTKFNNGFLEKDLIQISTGGYHLANNGDSTFDIIKKTASIAELNQVITIIDKRLDKIKQNKVDQNKKSSFWSRLISFIRY